MEELPELRRLAESISRRAARELNRTFLSALRRVEKRTPLRAKWTSDDGTIERFFDYVLKKTGKLRMLFRGSRTIRVGFAPESHSRDCEEI